MADATEIEIDDSLYSRQRYVLGDHAMKRMATSNVFLSGLNGLGVEIAKNVVLAGVKQLTIHDEAEASMADLSSQFYLSIDSLGSNRAKISFPKLKELNPYVSLQQAEENSLQTEDLSFLDKFHCVVLVGKPLALQLRINEYCHSKNIPFIACDVRGIVTWAFVDNGSEFVIVDANGENPSDIMIANITNANPAVISCLDNRYHDLESGDSVQFAEISGGCNKLNGNTYKVTVIDPHTFSINEDTSKEESFNRGNAIAQRVKIPQKISFHSLAESLKKPEIIDCDFSKFGTPQQLFLGMQTFYNFQEIFEKIPSPWSNADADAFVKIARSLNEEREKEEQLTCLDEDLLKIFAFTCSGELQCFSAFMGGVIGQEVIKSLSGKFTPLHQWMFLDAKEILPPLHTKDFDTTSFLPKNDRYDSLRICIGEETLTALSDTKLFMVGAGAIGCEMMKNFAMLGVSSGEKGMIHLTDNDLIEKSNLNRQFLFRPKDIQSPKSTTAANAATTMNRALHIEAMLDKVGPQTQNKFSDEFFSKLDLCVNALDNVEARLYMDQRIVANQKPLLESGTLGPKGHVQVVLPFLSESYASQSDPQSKDIPFCTLKSFPNNVDHCTIWARDLVFEENLVSKANDLRLFLDTTDLAQRLDDDDPELCRCLPNVAWLLRNKPESFGDCVKFARIFFEENYKNSMLQLITKFPLDHTMKDGTLFWAAPRRAPSPIEFTIDDDVHFSFIYHVAYLWAEIWDLKDCTGKREEIGAICDSVVLDPYVPSNDVEIETDENAEKPKGKEPVVLESSGDAKKFILSTLAGSERMNIFPLDFEKDDDTNHHIDLISAAANLRARCYSIKEASRLEIKRIAGNITPAIATTTSAVAGLVGLELIKLRMKRKENDEEQLERFKNGFLNLSISLYALSEPGPASRSQLTEKVSATMWDRWEVRGNKDFTLSLFFDKLKKKYGLTPMGVVQGSSMIYMPLPMYKKKLDYKMIDLLSETQHRKYDMVVTFNDSQGQDVEGVPVVRFTISKKSKSKSSKSSSSSKSKRTSKTKKSKKKDA